MVEYGYCHCGCGQKTTISNITRNARGIKKGEPVTYIHTHYVRQLRKDEYKVEDRGHDTPCWTWQKRVTRFGYGLRNLGRSGESAHLKYYREKYGPIPDGYEIDHLCRNRNCVNPEHLEAVTPAENVRRSNVAKLTPDEVRQIRSLYPFLMQKEIAARFNVSRQTIGMIFHNKIWQGVY